MPISEGKIITFLREARRELGKVVWPTRKQVIQHTVVVIVISLALAGIFGVLDTVFGWGIQELL